MTTRGIRNNNPGNIREPAGGGESWVGERVSDDDPDFEEFEKDIYGIRALCKVLITYQKHYNLMNVNDIISRWAPPSENDTDRYIHIVSKRLGVDKGDYINVQCAGTMELMVRAIIQHENGKQPYSDKTILTGMELAYA